MKSHKTYNDRFMFIVIYITMYIDTPFRSQFNCMKPSVSNWKQLKYWGNILESLL